MGDDVASPAPLERRRRNGRTDPTNPDADLDQRLAALARARGPLRRVLAALAGRLVESRGWEALGYARLRDYAAERLGIGTRSLYDLAHVDGALRYLPGVERALVTGRLTWTQVRLLVRVAKREDEARWLDYARRVTARTLSREVRAVDLGSLDAGAVATDEDGAPEEPRRGVVIRCAPTVNGIWFHVRRLAQRAAGERLPIWACMELVAAEVLSALPVEKVTSDPTAEGPEPPHGSRSWEPLPDVCTEWEPEDAPPTHAPYFLEALRKGLEEADAFELQRRLRRAVALEQRLDAQVGPLLRAVADSRLYRALGFTTLDAYARERLGMSPQRARALLRLERAGDHAPELLRAYREGSLSCVQALVLLPLVVGTGGWRFTSAWVEHATGVTVRRLEDDVEHALELREADPESWAETGGLPGTGAPGQGEIQKRQTGAKHTVPRETSQVFFVGPADALRLFRAVLCTVRRRMARETGRLPTQGEAFEAMLAARSRRGQGRPRVCVGSTGSSSATAGAARCRAARRAATCTTTTSCSARRAARTSSTTARPCAPGTTCAVCMRGSWAVADVRRMA